MKLIIYILITLSINACGIYSFTGASIDTNTKTVSVTYFNNKAPTIQPILSQLFTEKIKDIFIKETNLNLINESGDLSFSGYIENYNIKPISIKSDETAAKNRLTISVYVEFTSKNNPKNNFESKFSRYKDFDSGEDISEIEELLIDQICTELVEDIFNKAVVNW